jgi:hypothetical protein
MEFCIFKNDNDRTRASVPSRHRAPLYLAATVRSLACPSHAPQAPPPPSTHVTRVVHSNAPFARASRGCAGGVGCWWCLLGLSRALPAPSHRVRRLPSRAKLGAGGASGAAPLATDSYPDGWNRPALASRMLQNIRSSVLDVS